MDPGFLGNLVSEWYDREEPLAVALLRRAFATDHWNADLAFTVADLCVGISQYELSNDIMPAACWVWAAKSDGPASDFYYQEWEQAFSAATERNEGDIVILCVPYLIAGAIRGRCKPNYSYWFTALSQHADTPTRRRSVGKVLNGVRNVAEFLPSPAKVLLARLSEEFDDEMTDAMDGPSGETNDVLAILDIVEQQIPIARDLLGQGIWDRLSDNSRNIICESLGLYNSYQTIPGDRYNYYSFVMGLSNAILNEIDDQFCNRSHSDE